jgi:cell division protein FtsB
MEQIISSITSSLKDAKTLLKKQIKHTAMLEKEKLHSFEHQAKLRETHLRDIEAYKKRLDEAHQGQTQLRKEMDDLRTQVLPCTAIGLRYHMPQIAEGERMMEDQTHQHEPASIQTLPDPQQFLHRLPNDCNL